jgi:hypothetical protein
MSKSYNVDDQTAAMKVFDIEKQKGRDAAY